MAVLAGKLKEHRRRLDAAAAEIKRLESEIAETVSAGGDPTAQLRKIRSLRDGLGDLQNVVELADNAVEAAKGVSERVSSQMEEIFQKSIMEARNVVTEGLQAELQDIENRERMAYCGFLHVRAVGPASPQLGDGDYTAGFAIDKKRLCRCVIVLTWGRSPHPTWVTGTRVRSMPVEVERFYTITGFFTYSDILGPSRPKKFIRVAEPQNFLTFEQKTMSFTSRTE